MAEPANHEDDIDALIACLGDDASQIRNELANCRPNCEGFICEEWADSMEKAAATIASLCKQLDEARAWRTVECDGTPKCDSETVYIGINVNGFACCFNDMDHFGQCWHLTADSDKLQMSGLRWWRVLDRPDGVETGAAQQKGGA